MMSAYLIPVFPLLSFVILIFAGKHLREKSAWVALAAALTSLLLSLKVAFAVVGGAHFTHSIEWIRLGNLNFNFGLLIDPLTAMMLFVVAIVGTCVFVYSMGYMHDDKRYSRFFAYLSLFMFSMYGLILANHFLLLFMFWELVGVCSYLLIGFWFEKPSAALAARKAFLTTKVGDVGLFLGLLLLFTTTGTLSILDYGHHGILEHGHFSIPILTLASILIFFGAIGKSAQFPLHVWLPDAMEGPTSVSALIHAATMVAAGVYLIARAHPIFMLCPDAMQFVAITGTITAFMAAFIALTANDIKKVLAYSTISQLGYMVAALGLGGYAAGTFHLMTHAFFKALLFLGAGSVIHGAHTQDLREMGGLFSKMKTTAITFLIGSLAIAGVPPLSGFFSKDEILLSAFDSGNAIIYWVLVLTSFMTAFYMFRLFILAFLGKPRKEGHPHESPWVMTAPLIILAALAALAGLPGSPFTHHWLQGWLLGPHAHEIHVNLFVVACSVAAAGGGIGLAFVFYRLKPSLPAAFAKAFNPLYQASQNKFWLDEIYQFAVINPVWKLSKLIFKFDHTIVDGAVNQTATETMRVSVIKNWIDKNIVDGAVNAVGTLSQAASSSLRLIQTGWIQSYIFVLLLGLVIAFICLA